MLRSCDSVNRWSHRCVRLRSIHRCFVRHVACRTWQMRLDVVVRCLATVVALSACGSSGGPPSDCVPKKGAGCYTIDEPEFREAWNRLYPPSGSVRPPPDCSVPSLQSQPSASTSNARGLPQYLMSVACLTEDLRLRRVAR